MISTTETKIVFLDSTILKASTSIYHKREQINTMESKKYQKAKKRVKKKKEFREHLQSFITINLIMLGMGWMFGFFYAWQTVIFFWGIGLVFHYVDVYGIPGLGTDADWEKREMEKELRNMERVGTEEEAVQEELEADEFLDLDASPPVKEKKYNEDDLV